MIVDGLLGFVKCVCVWFVEILRLSLERTDFVYTPSSLLIPFKSSRGCSRDVSEAKKKSVDELEIGNTLR